MKRLMSVLLSAVAVLVAGVAQASIKVNVTEVSTGIHVANKWYQNGTTSGGTASIVDLTGLGGNLENSQPSPLSAAKLTTTLSNSSKAEIGTFGDFGLASTVLNDITLGYSFYRQNQAGGNTFAAPSIKLQISASFSDTRNISDNFGYLIYEPYWNGSVTSSIWQDVSINSSTGAGADGTGGWWWDGGFNIGNGGGGPPVRSLSEWVTAFQTSDGADFAKAHVRALSVGVGTYNQGQIDYFDNVSIKSAAGGVDTVYNFGAAPPVPEPATLIIWSLLGALTITVGWRRRQKA